MKMTFALLGKSSMFLASLRIAFYGEEVHKTHIFHDTNIIFERL